MHLLAESLCFGVQSSYFRGFPALLHHSRHLSHPRSSVVNMTRKSVYLVDFDCYRPPDELNLKMSYQKQGEMVSTFMDQDQMNFMHNILEKSAISQETFITPAGLQEPLELHIEKAKEEAMLVMCGAVEGLLDKTGILPEQIDTLITACSVFNTSPSLAAMLMKRFKMRPTTECFNLAGMGCATGVSGVELAANIMHSNPKKGYTLLVLHENLTSSLYTGKNKSYLLSNVLFRLGASALLLTDHESERGRAKYELQHVVRTVIADDDEAYNCMTLQLDEDNKMGIYLPPLKSLGEIAGRAIKKTMARLGPRILPPSEKAKFVKNMIERKYLKKNVPLYMPNWQKACKHIIIHPGGRAMIENVAKSLRLPIETQEPSMNALYWYGNTSSSSIWYAAGWAETVKGIKKGERMMQLGLGAGFESNASVWRALRDIDTAHNAWRHVLGGAEGEAKDVFMRVCRGESIIDFPVVRSKVGSVQPAPGQESTLDA